MQLSWRLLWRLLLLIQIILLLLLSETAIAYNTLPRVASGIKFSGLRRGKLNEAENFQDGAIVSDEINSKLESLIMTKLSLLVGKVTKLETANKGLVDQVTNLDTANKGLVDQVTNLNEKILRIELVTCDIIEMVI